MHHALALSLPSACLGRGSGAAAGATLDLQFTRSQYSTATANYGALSNLPGWSFSRASVKWVQNSAGVYSSVASGQPAVSDLGYLPEEARSALTMKSRRLDDTGVWTLSNMSTSAAQGVDLVLGSCTRLTATGANATALGSTTVIASSARRFAPFIRRVAGTGNIDISLDGGTTWNTQAVTSSFTRVGLGQTLANPQVAIRIVSSGDSIDVDFANGESGAFDTSPIESLATAFTRQPDVASIAVAGPSQGTIAVQAAAVAGDVTFRRALSLNDGSTNNETWVGVASGNCKAFVTVAAATQANLLNAVWSGAGKMALAYATNDFAAVFNNGAPGTDALGTVPTTTSLDIGHSAGLVQFCGFVQRAQLFSVRTANASLGGLPQ